MCCPSFDGIAAYLILPCCFGIAILTSSASTPLSLAFAQPGGCVSQVTIGAEGFYGPGSKWEKSNPQSWGSQIGQDFVENHKPSSVDYMTIHYWPENWKRCAPLDYVLCSLGPMSIYDAVCISKTLVRPALELAAHADLYCETL